MPPRSTSMTGGAAGVEPAARAGSVRLPAVKTGGCSSSSTVSGAAGDDAGVHLALEVPGGEVVDGVVAEADGAEGQVAHAPDPTPAPRAPDPAERDSACGRATAQPMPPIAVESAPRGRFAIGRRGDAAPPAPGRPGPRRAVRRRRRGGAAAGREHAADGGGRAQPRAAPPVPAATRRVAPPRRPWRSCAPGTRGGRRPGRPATGAALRALYVPGSVAGRRDVAMLDAWTGARAAGARACGCSCWPRRCGCTETPGSVLRRHRPAGPGASPWVAASGAAAAGRASTRTVELLRVARQWRWRPSGRARGRSRGPRGPQPAR